MNQWAGGGAPLEFSQRDARMQRFVSQSLAYGLHLGTSHLSFERGGEMIVLGLIALQVQAAEGAAKR